MQFAGTLLLCIGFLGSILLNPLSILAKERISYTEAGLIEEAYVTYATSNYFSLVEVLLDSIEVFSTRPIVVFGINADVPFSTDKYPFLIKKRIDISASSRENVFFLKPEVILQSPIQRGVYIDADMILNQGCDVLFEYCNRSLPYPLCPIFPLEVNNHKPVMDAMGVAEKSMPYVHGPLIIFTQHCFPFIEEWREANIKYGSLAPCHDETILNVLLCKHQICDYINLCDPYYDLVFDYLENKTDRYERHGYINWIGKIDFLTFHGCKNASTAKHALNLLIEKARNKN